MRRKIIVVGSLIAIVGMVMVITWRVLTAIPVAARPIAVELAYAASDGGSLGVEMRDANGRKLSVLLEGDLYREPKDFPLSVVRWLGPVPVWREIDRAGNEQVELTKLLMAAAEDSPANAEFLNSFVATLEERNGK